MASSKTARLRRRHAARKRHAKAARHAPAPVVVLPLRTGRAPDPYATGHRRSWSAVGAVGAASVITFVPAAHIALHEIYRPDPYYAAQAGAISADRPDYPHVELIEPWLYGLRATAGTARADIIVGPVDPWSELAARERYGWWGPRPYPGGLY